MCVILIGDFRHEDKIICSCDCAKVDWFLGCFQLPNLLRTYANDRAVAFVQFGDVEGVLSLLDYVVVELVPEDEPSAPTMASRFSRLT